MYGTAMDMDSKFFEKNPLSVFSVSAPVVWDALGLRAVVFVVFWGSWGGPPVLRDKGGLGSQDAAVSSVSGTRRRLRTI